MNRAQQMTHVTSGLLLLIAAICGCQAQPHSPNALYGTNLPGSEAEFLSMGDAAVTMDAARGPLERLDAIAGEWVIDTSYHPWKNAPPTSIRMISENKWILRKRCLQCRYQYNIPGEAIADLYILSWNPLKEEYGIDLYSSGWPLPTGGTGTWDEDSQTIKFVMTTMNPSTNQPITTLYCLSDIELNSHRWRQYRSGDNGELIPIITMEATRATSP
ncbi:MAG: DUF1579 family protein [Phycisphaerales bacterium]|nr:DUF1579 family protein [Phycisphaerales bacterium]